MPASVYPAILCYEHVCMSKVIVIYFFDKLQVTGYRSGVKTHKSVPNTLISPCQGVTSRLLPVQWVPPGMYLLPLF
jgi:hypothetical protein